MFTSNDENDFVTPGIKAASSDEAVASILAAVVCEAKNLHDSVTRISSSGLQLEEKRLCLEIMTFKERSQSMKCPLPRWVSNDQQIADVTTKMFEVDKMLNLLLRQEVG